MKITAALVKELREKTAAGMMDCKKALVEAEGEMEKAIDILREKGLSKAAKKSSRIAAEGLIGVEVAENGKEVAILEINSETDFVAKNEEFQKLVKDYTKLVLKHGPKDIEELMEIENNGKKVKDELNEKIAKIGENMNLRRFKKLFVHEGKVISYVHGDGRIAAAVKLETKSNDDKIEELGKDLAMQVAAMNPKYIAREDIDQDYVDHEREILKQQTINENNELPENKRKPEQILMKMLEGRLNKELKEVCLLEQAFIKEPKKTVRDVVKEYEKELNTTINVTEIVRFEVGEGLEKKEEDFAKEVAEQMK